LQEARNLTKLARNCVRDSPDYCVGMANEQRRERRKREIHLYLREDLVEALERVASDSDLSVSRVAEILLDFYWELRSLAEKWRFTANVNRRFRKIT